MIYENVRSLKISEIYPKVITAEYLLQKDLRMTSAGGHRHIGLEQKSPPVTFTIASVAIVKHGVNDELVLKFRFEPRDLVLTRPLAYQIARVLGDEMAHEWVGQLLKEIWRLKQK